ncbi:MAG: low temperature requirement protein A [Solirubrobacterales bacterium]|nr:low temperature requirement protein A [Solirubrobacterales bacterium]
MGFIALFLPAPRPPRRPTDVGGCEDWRVTTETTSARGARRLTAVLRQEEQVKPLELFFDLVFVLAITQCTALMSDNPTWEGLAKGLLVLGVLWWSWVGYAWLTSVVDPEEGMVRLVLLAAMAALLVVSLCVPEAFDDLALLFACAYGVVRAAQIALFVIASRDDPNLRRSVIGLAGGTAVGVGILVGASFADGLLQGALWALALLLDMGEPYLFGAEGWKLVPGHFAERHGLIIIIALGESIVAIGIGAEHGIDAGVVIAAVLGVAVAGALWWLYFDVVALVAARRLSKAAPGRERNDVARDCYSYLHFPMVAGIVLVALGLKKTLAHVDDPLELVPAVALLGGAALYLLAHVAFRWRNVHRFSVQRLGCAILLLALIPAATELTSLTTLAILAAILAALIAWEVRRFAELRDRLRHQIASETAQA